MNVELAIAKDGGVSLVSDEPFPAIIKRVEFYRDQRLFLLIYHNAADEDELMHYEIPENMAYSVEKSPDVIIFSVYPDRQPIGYKVPLIKVGDIY